VQLSVIIVNYNVSQFLQLCLDSVFDTIKNIEAEIIVVDNASVDDSCAMVKERYPNVRLIANTENVGFSKANNQGVREAKGDYVCILNPDVVLSEETFERLFQFIAEKKESSIGAIGIQLIDGAGKFLPESKRNLPKPSIALNKLFGKGQSYYANYLDRSDNGPVEILVGAFMFIEKAIYTQVGGFDERYFMYGEDIDLSYSIYKAGYENYYMGDVSAIHYKGESTAKDATYRKRFYGAMHLFYKKHFRQNIAERILVKVGLKAAMIMAAIKMILSRSKKEKTITSQKNYYLISDNETVIGALRAYLPHHLEIVKTLPNLIPEKSEIIMDSNYLSFGMLIEVIKAQTSSACTFKIIPKNSTFALGSNSSKHRGEVINF